MSEDERVVKGECQIPICQICGKEIGSGHPDDVRPVPNGVAHEECFMKSVAQDFQLEQRQ